MAQNPGSDRNRTTEVPPLSFARDHQDKAFFCAVGILDEIYQPGMRFRQGQAVQINPAFG